MAVDQAAAEQVTYEISDKEVLKLLKRLAEPRAMLIIGPLNMSRAIIVVEKRASDTRSEPNGDDGATEWVTIASMERNTAVWLVINELVSRVNETGAVSKYKLSDGGRRKIKELLNIHKKHRNVFENPLNRLNRRTDFINTELYKVGLRFREIVERGGDVEWIKERIGPYMFGLIMAVCCDGEGVESYEKRARLPARSAKLMLKVGLEQLKTMLKSESEATTEG